jgi:hypothetical protein
MVLAGASPGSTPTAAEAAVAGGCGGGVPGGTTLAASSLSGSNVGTARLSLAHIGLLAAPNAAVLPGSPLSTLTSAALADTCLISAGATSRSHMSGRKSTAAVASSGQAQWQSPAGLSGSHNHNSLTVVGQEQQQQQQAGLQQEPQLNLQQFLARQQQLLHFSTNGSNSRSGAISSNNGARPPQQQHLRPKPRPASADSKVHSRRSCLSPVRTAVRGGSAAFKAANREQVKLAVVHFWGTIVKST